MDRRSVERKFKPTKNSSLGEWQGQLENEDIVRLTQLVRKKTGETLYKEIAERQAAVQIHAPTIIKLQDQFNTAQAIEELRKILPPGYLPPKKQASWL